MIGVVVMNAVGASASASMLAKIMVLSLVGKVKMLTFLQRCTGHQVVKDMEILLSRWHSCHPVVFETLVKQLDTTQPPLVCELELCIFSKARCIWIKERASVSKQLDDEFCCGHWLVSLAPFFPGLDTDSSRSVLMVRQQLSNFLLPICHYERI